VLAALLPVVVNKRLHVSAAAVGEEDSSKKSHEPPVDKSDEGEELLELQVLFVRKFSQTNVDDPITETTFTSEKVSILNPPAKV